MEKESIITIGEHNRFYGKLCLTKKFLKSCNLEVGDKVKVNCLEEGKILIEKVEK